MFKKRKKNCRTDSIQIQMEESRIQQINKQIKRGRFPHHCFMHLSKTGGAGIKDFGWELVEKGYSFPVHFPHVWTLEAIITYFPDMSVCFIIRDPIERIISGFYSRLRQGRPRKKNSIWSPGEATAFSFFNSPQQFLYALISEDDHQKSAALFAYKNITHLAYNYVHFFKDTNYIDKMKNRISIVEQIKSTDKFLLKLCLEFNIPNEEIDNVYKKIHVSPVSAKEVLSKFNKSEIEKLKFELSPEYKIYNHLKGYITDF